MSDEECNNSMGYCENLKIVFNGVGRTVTLLADSQDVVILDQTHLLSTAGQSATLSPSNDVSDTPQSSASIAPIPPPPPPPPSRSSTGTCSVDRASIVPPPPSLSCIKPGSAFAAYNLSTMFTKSETGSICSRARLCEF
jgi:hypothetical protein